MIAGIPGRAARTRNPYSRSWLWIPGLRPVAHPGMTRRLLLRRALDKRLAALHLVGERCFVDLDHDRIGVDAEVLHQRLRDVTHHAGLLLVGAAGGHAHGNFRHFLFLPFLFPSWPGQKREARLPVNARPSTISSIKQDVDARHKAGHDAGMNGYPHLTSCRASTSS